jgi:diketogulonate reductase-like aldo/keto reductase
MVPAGTWKASPGDAGKIVENALKVGYRHLDFAMMYGNQAEIGTALTKVFKEGKVKREDVWMTSKVTLFSLSAPKALSCAFVFPCVHVSQQRCSLCGPVLTHAAAP